MGRLSQNHFTAWINIYVYRNTLYIWLKLKIQTFGWLHLFCLNKSQYASSKCRIWKWRKFYHEILLRWKSLSFQPISGITVSNNCIAFCSTFEVIDNDSHSHLLLWCVFCYYKSYKSYTIAKSISLLKFQSIKHSLYISIVI